MKMTKLVKLEKAAISACLARYEEWLKEYPEGIWPPKRYGAPQGLARKALLATKHLYDYKRKKAAK